VGERGVCRETPVSSCWFPALKAAGGIPIVASVGWSPTIAPNILINPKEPKVRKQQHIFVQIHMGFLLGAMLTIWMHSEWVLYMSTALVVAEYGFVTMRGSRYP